MYSKWDALCESNNTTEKNWTYPCSLSEIKAKDLLRCSFFSLRWDSKLLASVSISSSSPSCEASTAVLSLRRKHVKLMFECKPYRSSTDETRGWHTNPSSYLKTSEYLEKRTLTSRLASKMKRHTENWVTCLTSWSLQEWSWKIIAVFKTQVNLNSHHTQPHICQIIDKESYYYIRKTKTCLLMLLQTHKACLQLLIWNTVPSFLLEMSQKMVHFQPTYVYLWALVNTSVRNQTNN